MNFLQRTALLERMHHLIRLNATGSPKQFAHIMGISESSLYELLKIAKELGADIEFCNTRDSYIYKLPVELQFGYTLI
ncbi:hypothetical protein [Saccharicrinis aurantiacus]|uniref:hypothetical protein n=1 Tax=Saccharicrinis aurantiacus TaxID=1849719 RepID=UPI00249384AA|nr:hypothetical protein [Saccharicrinis aurantiacus]